MEQKINIAELLKDCPEGMELDCAIYKNVTLLEVADCDLYPIRIKTKSGFISELTKFGQNIHNDDAKCVIFPKGKTTWEGFVPPFSFKDGDIVATDDGWIGITTGGKSGEFIPTHCVIKHVDEFEAYLDRKETWMFHRLATEEEKAKLFQAIKDNGYKWNEETKTLEKLSVPSTPEKFYIRIGDIPSEEKLCVYRGDVVVGYEDGVSVYDCVETDGLYRIVMPFPLKEGQGMTYECLIQEITQCRYEIENPRNVYLVSGIEVGKGHDNEPLIKNVKILKDLTEQFNTKNDNTEENKPLEILIKPKFKVGDEIVKRDSIVNSWIVSSVNSEYYGLKTRNGSECIGVMSIAEQDEYELLPNKFDINNLKPFDKVLVRSDNSDVWECDFFSSYNPKCSNRFHCIGAWYNICIPYIGNEQLRRTTDDCDEFYKNW